MSHIPYADPRLPAPLNPRPTAVLVLGILGIILGAFGTLGGACGIISNFLPLNRDNPAMQAMYHDLAWRGVVLVTTVLQFILSLLLLIGSVFLLSLRPWARRLLLGYGWGQLALWLLLTLTNVLWIMPRMHHLLAGQKIDAAQRKIMQSSQLFGLLCGLLWPVFAAAVLILLTRPAIKAAFAPRPVSLPNVPPPPGAAPGAPDRL